jgi:hypothetical protein
LNCYNAHLANIIAIRESLKTTITLPLKARNLIAKRRKHKLAQRSRVIDESVR